MAPKTYMLQHRHEIYLDHKDTQYNNCLKFSIKRNSYPNKDKDVQREEQKITELVLGYLGLIFVTPLIIPLMAIAYLNPEIRFKYLSLANKVALPEHFYVSEKESALAQLVHARIYNKNNCPICVPSKTSTETN